MPLSQGPDLVAAVRAMLASFDNLGDGETVVVLDGGRALEAVRTMLDGDRALEVDLCTPEEVEHLRRLICAYLDAPRYSPKEHEAVSAMITAREQWDLQGGADATEGS